MVYCEQCEVQSVKLINSVNLFQVWLSTVMFDLCNIFKKLQKIFQKSDLILLDVITARDATIVNLNVMKEMPVPGGKEENYLKELEGCSHDSETDESDGIQMRVQRSRTNVRNSYITITNRKTTQ